jgi:SAM-dependent methyltransferase
MSLRRIAERFLPPVAVDAMKRPVVTWQLMQFHRGGRVPWSRGYNIYKWQLLRQILSDDDLIDRFRRGESLPPGYGVGVDERCVEYPWLLANLEDCREALLDAGSTLNHDFILDHPLLRKKIIHILTLAPEGNCFWQKSISYLFHDLQEIPMRDDCYDTIVCVSTLEHVGCDNAHYTGGEAARENRPEGFILAMKELYRVLKPGGTLLLTVPFGVYRHFGMFQQFDRDLLSRAVKAFGRDGTRPQGDVLSLCRRRLVRGGSGGLHGLRLCRVDCNRMGTKPVAGDHPCGTRPGFGGSRGCLCADSESMNIAHFREMTGKCPGQRERCRRRSTERSPLKPWLSAHRPARAG